MDDDILSQGEDREPRPWSPWTWLAGSRLARSRLAGRWRAGRWPRRLAVTGAAIALATGGAVYLSRPGPRAPVAAARPAATSPAPAPAVTGDGDLPPVQDGIAGLTEPWTSSLRLPATGAQPAWYSPATGRSQAIGGLPAVSSGYQFTQAGNGWAVQPNPAARTACGDCAVPALPVWYLGDGARSAVPVGQANAVAPAATPGALWLTSFPPRAPAGAAGMAREISLTGATAGTPVRLPPGYEVARGTARGLLLAPAAGPEAMAPDQLWDPAAAGAGRALPPVLAATATEVAWAAGCARLCRVVIDNLTTGKQATVTLPKGTSAASAAFSPGGDYLALQVNSTSAGDNGALAVRLEVAPAATGRLTAVPGTFASSDALVGFGWPGSGNSLVAEFTFTTKTQLAAWSPGNAWLDVAVVRPDVSDLALIVG